MQCEEFEDRLNAVLDERQRPEADPELRLHCETCAECRQLAADYGALMNGFFTLVTREATSTLAARVLAELHPPRVVERPRRSVAVGLAAVAMATAASVLVAVPLIRSFSVDATTVAQADPKVQMAKADSAATPNAATETVGVAQAAPSLDQETQVAQATLAQQAPIVRNLLAIRNDGTDPYRRLAAGTGQGLANVVMALPGNSGRRRLSASQGPVEPPSAIEVVEEALNPITDTVSATFSLLLRSIPGSAG